MDPVAFAVGGFPDEFVEMGVVHEPAEPFAISLIVVKVSLYRLLSLLTARY